MKGFGTGLNYRQAIDASIKAAPQAATNVHRVMSTCENAYKGGKRSRRRKVQIWPIDKRTWERSKHSKLKLTYWHIK